ncbi:MAG: DUF748 domain-containing protein [Idiomarina sp.]|nr:DUF748 domain-containing protein [Idiomarina sp.]
MHSGSISQFGHYLREKWLSPRRIRFWLLIIFIINVLLGFFALPPVVEHYAKKIVREDFDRELQVETVRTNPFNLTLRMDELMLLDTDEAPLLDIGQLDVDLAWSSFFSAGWRINSIRIESPIVHEERFASGETRLMRLVQEAVDEDETDDDPSDLAFKLKFFHIQDGEVRFTDNLADNDDEDTPSQVTLALQNIDFTLEDLIFNDDSLASMQFEGYLAGGGELTFDGELQMQPGTTVQGELGINDVELPQLAPYLLYYLGLQLESGVLSVNGDLNTSEQQPLAFEGNAGIENLLISQAPDDEALLGWQRLHTNHIHLDFYASELETDMIYLQGLVGQLVINQDQTTNFSELFDTPPADDARAEEDESNGADEAIAVETENEGTAQTADGSEQLTPFGIVIKGIALSDSSIEFTDDSLPLPFSTSIHSLEGEVSTISSTSAQPARLELEGQVDDYGLARAEGALHVFDPTHQTEIKVTFRNLEIPEYSPYTVNFAGRTIAGGTMDLDLTYTIDSRQLEGQNNMVIRNLELGEHIDGDNGMDLPLRIAIALLEDRDGVIDLTLPVRGDVDDPEFDVNAIVREALWRALTTVVETPFRLLADVLDSDSEDLGQVDFAEGRSDLAPPERERIAELLKALDTQPDLVLKIAGPYSRDFDGEAIKQQQAEEALREHLAEAGRDEDDPSLTSEENLDAVETLFASYYPDSDIDAVRERYTDTQGEEDDFDDLAYRNYLAQQIIAMQSVSDEALQALGNARAAAVRDALVDTDEGTGIASDRVHIIDPIAVDSVEGERIVLEIGVDAD